MAQRTIIKVLNSYMLKLVRVSKHLESALMGINQREISKRNFLMSGKRSQ